MRSRYNIEYCGWDGCTRGIQPGTGYCFEHNREAADLALQRIGLLADTGSNDLFETCEACSKPKRRDMPCKTCREAERELRASLDEDPDELFDL